MAEHPEPDLSQIATQTYRFDIERFCAGAVSLHAGLDDEIDCWEVARRTEGEWDHVVLDAFLAEFGAPGTYRVIRYGDHYQEISYFEVEAERRWLVSRHAVRPEPVQDGES
jgi:hypothetical protein